MTLRNTARTQYQICFGDSNYLKLSTQMDEKANISANHAQFMLRRCTVARAEANAGQRGAHLRRADVKRHQPGGRISQDVEVGSRGRPHGHGTAFWVHLVVDEPPLLQESVYSMRQRHKFKPDELTPCWCLTAQEGDSTGRNLCFSMKT